MARRAVAREAARRRRRHQTRNREAVDRPRDVRPTAWTCERFERVPAAKNIAHFFMYVSTKLLLSPKHRDTPAVQIPAHFMCARQST